MQEGNAQVRNKGTFILGRIWDVACMCRSGIRKAKDHLELNLTRAAKNKKGFTGMSATKVRLKKMNLCNK